MFVFVAHFLDTFYSCVSTKKSITELLSRVSSPIGGYRVDLLAVIVLSFLFLVRLGTIFSFPIPHVSVFTRIDSIRRFFTRLLLTPILNLASVIK